MSITDELREWTEQRNGLHLFNMQLNAIADRIDAEYQKAIRELNSLADASVLLPVDTDGEVIHVGDAMERRDAHGRVIALMLSKYPKKWGGALHWGIQLEGEQAPTAIDGFFRHYHKPTVENVLREFTDAILEWAGKSGTVAEVGTWSDVAAEYAAKLQLRGEDE